MKQPDKAQLDQLMLLRQYNKVVEYLSAVEQDYIDKLITEKDQTNVSELQGSIKVVRALQKHITHDPR